MISHDSVKALFSGVGGYATTSPVAAWQRDEKTSAQLLAQAKANETNALLRLQLKQLSKLHVNGNDSILESLLVYRRFRKGFKTGKIFSGKTVKKVMAGFGKGLHQVVDFVGSGLKKALIAAPLIIGFGPMISSWTKKIYAENQTLLDSVGNILFKQMQAVLHPILTMNKLFSNIASINPKKLWNANREYILKNAKTLGIKFIEANKFLLDKAFDMKDQFTNYIASTRYAKMMGHVYSTVRTKLSALAGDTATIIENSWDWAKETYEDNALRRYLADLWPTIADNIDPRKLISQLGNFAFAMLPDVISNAKDFALNMVKATATDLFNYVGDLFGGAWDALKTKVWDWLGTLPNMTDRLKKYLASWNPFASQGEATPPSGKITDIATRTDYNDWLGDLYGSLEKKLNDALKSMTGIGDNIPAESDYSKKLRLELSQMIGQVANGGDAGGAASAEAASVGTQGSVTPSTPPLASPNSPTPSGTLPVTASPTISDKEPVPYTPRVPEQRLPANGQQMGMADTKQLIVKPVEMPNIPNAYGQTIDPTFAKYSNADYRKAAKLSKGTISPTEFASGGPYPESIAAAGPVTQAQMLELKQKYGDQYDIKADVNDKSSVLLAQQLLARDQTNALINKNTSQAEVDENNRKRMERLTGNAAYRLKRAKEIKQEEINRRPLRMLGEPREPSGVLPNISLGAGPVPYIPKEARNPTNIVIPPPVSSQPLIPPPANVTLPNSGMGSRTSLDNSFVANGGPTARVEEAHAQANGQAIVNEAEKNLVPFKPNQPVRNNAIGDSASVVQAANRGMARTEKRDEDERMLLRFAHHNMFG